MKRYKILTSTGGATFKDIVIAERYAYYDRIIIFYIGKKEKFIVSIPNLISIDIEEI